MIQQYLATLVDGNNLTQDESSQLMRAMMDGEISPAQAGAVLTTLRMKGETVNELAGLAKVMREKALRLPSMDPAAVDICGTGGDGGRTFNISTAAAIVAAATGVKVAKHGNRAVSSKSGSADVLEALGVDIQQDENTATRALKEQGICFLFAPLFHQAMKNVMPIRRELGFRTCFNLLGPLANPARVTRQLVGVYDSSLTEPVAKVLQLLGIERAMVVAGLDGIDEISVTGETQISELKDGQVKTYSITPEEMELNTTTLAQLSGGDAQQNAQIIHQVFLGEQGPKRDVILANAGAVITIAGHTATIQEGIRLAAEAIDSGMALAKLEQMKMPTLQQREEIHHVS
ncbi:anthranilate phosphoribosyltransferase [Marininema mesophilum]|uniref:Anthranilate phosphoribosyltransferase n=1 Tax=Marininema mesophilum TaxID=1048340 RepID=A0A1H2UST2_9BACL|nr:anthranilate phosphoribosyltransferase [Marininema mesophilum]SDW59177.1 anthranilate phosphoribosyltransferase [Marininema mesophilum]